jgi:hypothetical protein
MNPTLHCCYRRQLVGLLTEAAAVYPTWAALSGPLLVLMGDVDEGVRMAALDHWHRTLPTPLADRLPVSESWEVGEKHPEQHATIQHCKS